MKQRKTPRIISLILTIALVLSSLTALSVLAEGDTPATPEIISKNASFDDNIHLYFAVPADGIDKDNISLAVYADADCTEELTLPVAPEAETENVHGTECYVFRTLGIAPKNADMTIYVQAVNTVDGTEYKSAVTAYSVLDYLYEMLYKDGFIAATEGIALTQKNLYLTTLDYCSYAQDLFVNHKDTDATNDVKLFNEYAYVAVKDGTVDGKSTATYPKGEDTEVTLVAAKETAGMIWEVTEYADGSPSVTQVDIASNNETKVKINESTVIKLVDNTTLRFSSESELKDTSKIAMSSGVIWEDGRVKITADGTGTITERFRVYPTSEARGKSKIVFEADFSVDYSDANENKPNGTLYFSPLSVTTNGSSALGTKYCLIFDSAQKRAYIYLSGTNATGTALTGEDLNFKIRYTYELDSTAGTVTCTAELVNTDGTVQMCITKTNTSTTSPDSCLTFEICANSNLGGVFYVDNVSYCQK